MGEHRATQAGEKKARQDLIAAAATDLLERFSYRDITMEHIASHARVAKGTLYLYFRTKESIFLRLFEDLLDSWYGELEALAHQGTATIDPATAARVISSTLVARPVLISLHGLLNSTICPNIDFESAGAFNRRQHQRALSLAAALSMRISGLSDAQALRFLIRLQAVIGGLAWAAPASASTKRTVEETNLSSFQIDFEEELTEIATKLLR